MWPWTACMPGWILLGDVVKEHAAQAIRRLKAEGIEKTVMLTGDADAAAQQVASQLGVDEVHSQLLPADKVRQVERLLKERKEGQLLAFVGDGINDAPVLARGRHRHRHGRPGSDAAIEAADVVLMDDDPAKIALAMRISRADASHRIREHRVRPGGEGGVPGAGRHRYCQYVAGHRRGCGRDGAGGAQRHPGPVGWKRVKKEGQPKPRKGVTPQHEKTPQESWHCEAGTHSRRGPFAGKSKSFLIASIYKKTYKGRLFQGGLYRFDG